MTGRKQPYTETGIKRLPCARCGKPASEQWKICADGNLWRPICVACDIGLNDAVLRYMRDGDRKAKMAVYRNKMAPRGGDAPLIR